MDDEAILALFRQRQESALAETAAKYGRPCYRVADNILSDSRDAEECVNDTWLHAWNSIPPEHPEQFSAWLIRVTRNLALSRLRRRMAKKRGGDQITLVIDELAECLPGKSDPQREMERRELAEYIDRFLATLRPQDRDVFVARYFFAATMDELAGRTGWTKARIHSMLQRTRGKLRNYLTEEALI